MRKLKIIHNEQFQQLKELEKAYTYTSQRKKVTNEIYDDIEAILGRKLRKAVKVQLVIRRIIYLASDRGFCFVLRETLANRLNVSISTIDNAIRLIKDSGEMDVFYRENPRSNSAKTPVFILKRHKNYPSIKQVLKQLYVQVWEEELQQKSTESKDNPIKKISTSLLQKRQDSKLNKHLHPFSKIVEYLAIKIEETQQNNPKGIQALSSYIDVLLRSEQKKASVEVEKGKKHLYKPIGIPIYNWLEA